MISIILSVSDVCMHCYVCICTYVLGVSLISMPTLNPNTNEKIRSMRLVVASKGSLFWSMMPSTSRLTSGTLKHVGSECDNFTTSSCFVFSPHLPSSEALTCLSLPFLVVAISNHPSVPLSWFFTFTPQLLSLDALICVYDFPHCTFPVYRSPTDQVSHCTLVSQKGFLKDWSCPYIRKIPIFYQSIKKKILLLFVKYQLIQLALHLSGPVMICSHLWFLLWFCLKFEITKHINLVKLMHTFWVLWSLFDFQSCPGTFPLSCRDFHYKQFVTLHDIPYITVWDSWLHESFYFMFFL